MKSSRFKNTLALLTITLGSFAVQTPARAALGIYLASAYPNEGTYGAILAAIGLGVSIASASGRAVQQTCTPSNPCTNVNMGDDEEACLDGSFGTDDQGCTEDGLGGNRLYSYFTGTLTNGSTITYHEFNPLELVIGLVLLGNDRVSQANLRPITADMAKSMSVSPKEATAFNHELPQINLLMNDFASRLDQEKGTSSQMKTQALQLWETEAKPVLSADAYSALQKAGATYSALMN